MKLALLGVCLVFSGAVWAGQENVLPTCYNKQIPAKPGSLDTEIYVAIDQTTNLDANLKQLVADNIRPFLKQNNGFSVIAFSAYTQGRYLEVLVSGKLDPILDTSERNDISKPVLAKFDQCMARQPQQAAQVVGGALRAAFEGSSNDIARSDVMASMKAISAKVRTSTARNKVVLIVSDMLENSSVSSFYANKGQSVRQIDPDKEMKIAESNQLIADFNGARVYVIGAGLLPSDSKKEKRYRDPKTMQALSTFWGNYFERSKSQLIEFGQPALLNPVQ